ncbi:MAG TPA: zf-HC2 domain-containing protein [Burkholderiaceae bacterium]|nr:zf-HC2 domain-containing protein [Burkholderiaceae bacterium]
MKFLARNCRQVTALVLAGQDRSLGFVERWAVRVHLTVCAACPKFFRQVALMREAMPRWRAYRDGADG